MLWRAWMKGGVCQKLIKEVGVEVDRGLFEVTDVFRVISGQEPWFNMALDPDGSRVD